MMTGESPRFFFRNLVNLQGFLVIACFASRISHTSGDSRKSPGEAVGGGAMEDPPEVWSLDG